MTQKKILYIDMDNVLVDFNSGIKAQSAEILNKYAGRLDEISGIFSLMVPNKGALDAYKVLCRHFDTYILSTSPWENPTAASEKVGWVKKYLGKYAYKKLILSHHKNLNKGDFLIDDRPNNGANQFEGEWIQFDIKEDSEIVWRGITSKLIAKEPIEPDAENPIHLGVADYWPFKEYAGWATGEVIDYQSEDAKKFLDLKFISLDKQASSFLETSLRAW